MYPTSVPDAYQMVMSHPHVQTIRDTDYWQLFEQWLARVTERCNMLKQELWTWLEDYPIVKVTQSDELKLQYRNTMMQKDNKHSKCIPCQKPISSHIVDVHVPFSQEKTSIHCDVEKSRSSVSNTRWFALQPFRKCSSIYSSW